ncbi:hypothetical protein AURDEDRAFT_181528 [Auricularia subglabra TFB-10046 SS5]|nr:hypothetical protein AURDEDRAFT_181528 [Auricularia subglabra TFB-10046 SS5]
MANPLADRVYRLEDAFFAALKHGPAAVAKFNTHYLAVFREVELASLQGTLPDHVGRLMHSVSATIMEHAQTLRSLDVDLDEAVQSTSSDSSGALEHFTQALSPRASLPLFRYFLDNICSPYPESEEKERVAEAVRELGWCDFDKKKFEDWLNRKRVQCGFVAILRRYCDGDRDAMRHLCRTALHGSKEEKASLPDGALDDFEDMHDFMQSQHDELIEETDTDWVDELATGVQAIMGEDSAADDDDECPTSDNDDYDSNSDSDSDSDSNWSETDVEDDEGEDEEPPRAIIGAKRKLTDSSDCSPLVTSRPLFRSLSMASSTSSSSSSTACSLRSFSGSSMSSVTSVEFEDAICDRPMKRSRSDSCSSDPKSMLWTSSPVIASPDTTQLTDPLFTTYRNKRKLVGDDLSYRTRAMKRSRYVALGVASQASNVSAAQLASLSELCRLDWTPVEAVVRDLDASSYTVDCTLPGDEDSDDEDFALLIDRQDGEPAKGIPTWSKLQIYIVLRMLLSVSDRPLPAPLTQSAMYAFDVDTVGAHNVLALEEMMKLSPEALSAMFDAMNALAPAPAEESAILSTEDVLLVFEAPNAAQDAPIPILDAPAPAHDIFPSLVDVPVLSIDTSAPALETPPVAPEEPLSPPEESHSPTSSFSSEGDSPPALSDDSGLSSRSSSVEPDSEQDSLLMSPAALSADYSKLYAELTAEKALDADPSQFMVEFGAVPEVVSADELSSASELLERYLNDPMTGA